MKRIFIVLCTFITMFGASEAFGDPKDVLIIQSYHPDLEWVVQCEKGIRSVLEPQYHLDMFYLDSKRLPESDYQLKADDAWSKYQEVQPDLVMIGDDNALRFLGPKFSETDVPVVFFGINNNPRSYFDTLPANITGVLERVPLFPWIRHIQKIMPTARRALVLFDKSPTADSILEVTFGGRNYVNVTGLDVEYLVLGAWEDWKKLILDLEGFDFIIVPTFHALKNRTGGHVDVNEVIEWTSGNCPVPLFSHQDYTVGSRGAVGSYVIFGESHGRLAGKIAADILDGRTPVSKVPPKMDQTGMFYFNAQQLQRFDLELPEKIRKVAIFK